MSVFLTGAASFAVFVNDGDSISVTAPLQTNFTGLERNVFAPFSADSNLAQSGSTIANVASRASTVDALYNASAEINILEIFVGANDLWQGASDTTIFNALKSYCAARRAVGWKVVLGTLLPQNFGACVSGGCETTRLSVNSMIRADTSFYDALADIGDTSTFMGNIANNSNATYYSQPDGIHPTNPVGHALLAPYFQVAVRSLIPVVH